MSKYDVDYKKLAVLLLPMFLRKTAAAGFAFPAVNPVSYIHTLFNTFRSDRLYRITHNGQVCYLRAVLNDTFDPEERRITISDSDAVTGDSRIFWRELNISETAPMRGDPPGMAINRRGYGGLSGLDFWVNIPLELMDVIDLMRLRAVINTFKLASKRYSINYV